VDDWGFPGITEGFLRLEPLRFRLRSGTLMCLAGSQDGVSNPWTTGSGPHGQSERTWGPAHGCQAVGRAGDWNKLQNPGILYIPRQVEDGMLCSSDGGLAKGAERRSVGSVTSCSPPTPLHSFIFFIEN
jgi:hypothetical protein